MKRLLNLLRRACALYAIRALEIELHEQTEALQHIKRLDAYGRIYRARCTTQNALLEARRHYTSLLPPGERRTWRTA